MFYNSSGVSSNEGVEMPKPVVRLIANGDGYLLVTDLGHIKQIRSLLGQFENHAAHKGCHTYLGHSAVPQGGWDVQVFPRYVKASAQLVVGRLEPKFKVKLCAGDANPHEDDGRSSMDLNEWVRSIEVRLNQRF